MVYTKSFSAVGVQYFVSELQQKRFIANSVFNVYARRRNTKIVMFDDHVQEDIKTPTNIRLIRKLIVLYITIDLPPHSPKANSLEITTIIHFNH